MSLKLIVVIPVYNEIHNIDTVLSKVFHALPRLPKELLWVDDSSIDGLVQEWLFI